MPNPPNISDLRRQQRISQNFRTSFRSVLTQGSNSSQDNSTIIQSTPSLTPINTNTPSSTLSITSTPTNTPSLTPTNTSTPIPTITPSITPTLTVTVTQTTVTQTPTITQTTTANLELLAKEKIVMFYNLNSPDSVDVANYYKNNRPYFSQINLIGLDVQSFPYPQRRAGDGTTIISESGADIDVPYEGCRKYDLILSSVFINNIAKEINNYLDINRNTQYLVFSIDMPFYMLGDSYTTVPFVSTTMENLDYVPTAVRRSTANIIDPGGNINSGLFPFYLTANSKQDIISYINKLSRAQTDGLELYNNRLCAYAEDSNGYPGWDYFSLPNTSYKDLSGFYMFRSGRNTVTTNRDLTGMFCDISNRWPHNTGSLSGNEISYFGTWGFNGRRYIQPSGPYLYNAPGYPGEEVAGLSAISYYNDPMSIGKLTFNNPSKIDGWYFTFTVESFNGCPGGGNYGPLTQLVPHWGRFPSTYTGVKTFSAFKNSQEYQQGLRPIRHSHYGQYFSVSAFGGSSYENTPIGWAGHLAEPISPILRNNHIDSWLRGDNLYNVVMNNLASNSINGVLLAIGDPLVYVRTPAYNIPVTPSPTPTPTVAPVHGLPVFLCVKSNNTYLSSFSGTFQYHEGGEGFAIYHLQTNGSKRFLFDNSIQFWGFYTGSYPDVTCELENQSVFTIPTTNYVDVYYNEPVIIDQFTLDRCVPLPSPTPTKTPRPTRTPIPTLSPTPTL